MKVIDASFLENVSGAGNFADNRNGGGRVNNNNNNNGGNRGAPKTAANDAAVAGLISAGAAVAAGAGPFGIAVAGIGAGVITAMGYPSNSPNNGGRDQGAFGGNSNPNSVNGQCRW